MIELGISTFGETTEIEGTGIAPSLMNALEI